MNDETILEVNETERSHRIPTNEKPDNDGQQKDKISSKQD